MWQRKPERNDLVSVEHRYEDVYDVTFDKPAGRRTFTCRRSSLEASLRGLKRRLRREQGERQESTRLAILCHERKLAAIAGQWNPSLHGGTRDGS
jgi:hypothetical protein